MYRDSVVKCAANVAFGIALIGSLRFELLLAPWRIPVQALKNIACSV